MIALFVFICVVFAGILFIEYRASLIMSQIEREKLQKLESSAKKIQEKYIEIIGEDYLREDLSIEEMWNVIQNELKNYANWSNDVYIPKKNKKVDYNIQDLMIYYGNFSPPEHIFNTPLKDVISGMIENDKRVNEKLKEIKK